jgi:hypothetical protein
MDTRAVRSGLAEVLRHIQVTSSYGEPDIKDTTCPLKDLQGFDSQMGVVATTLLSERLGIEIPPGANVFKADGKARALPIAETVAIVVGLAERASVTARTTAHQKVAS